MTRVRTAFVCRECGSETLRWEGRCPTCAAWNSLVESQRTASRKAVSSRTVPRVEALGRAQSTGIERIRTGFGDVDRVLGGGIVPGTVVLLGGAPGIGKSTLLLQLAGHLTSSGHSVLYASGEESAEQVAMRATRLGTGAEVDFLSTHVLEDVVAALRDSSPSLLCVDSIQTIGSGQSAAAPGGVAQVREAAALLQRESKEAGAACLLVGHVTKGGVLAGPRTLEHLVDVVLHFEGQRSGEHRILRGSKNRFGSVDELAAFRMSGKGLVAVADPSTFFLTPGGAETSGAAITVPLQGSRPILAEVQALVARARFSSPQRVCTGLSSRRLSILLAVLEKRAGQALGEQDVFVNVVGGLRMGDPASDLAVIAALMSAGADRPFGPGMGFFGEVGLGGEVRAVSQGRARLRAALDAGLKRVVVPAGLQVELEDRVDRVRFARHVTDVAEILCEEMEG